MEAIRADRWSLGTDILSSGSDEKITLGCEGSIVPHPISDQDILLRIFWSLLLLLVSSKQNEFLYFAKTAVFQIYYTSLHLALFIGTTLWRSDTSVCARILLEYQRKTCVAEIRSLFKFLPQHPPLHRFNFLSFDPTKGYPGEGWRWQKTRTRRMRRRARRKWSKKHPTARIATWNCRSLTEERFKCL